jgi:hypothetical protein
MNRVVQAVVSVVVGAAVASGAAFALVSSQTSTPDNSQKELVVYDG